MFVVLVTEFPIQLRLPCHQLRFGLPTGGDGAQFPNRTDFRNKHLYGQIDL